MKSTLKWGIIMMIKGNQAAVKGLPRRSSKADNKKRICYFCIHTGQPEDRRAICSDFLFEVNMLIQQLLEYWLRPLGLALPETADSVRGWPTSNDMGYKDPALRLNLGPLRRATPGAEFLTEFTEGSVLAFPYSLSFHPSFLTDVSPSYTLQQTFWMQFSISESGSREPNQRQCVVNTSYLKNEGMNESASEFCARFLEPRSTWDFPETPGHFCPTLI